VDILGGNSENRNKERSRLHPKFNHGGAAVAGKEAGLSFSEPFHQQGHCGTAQSADATEVVIAALNRNADHTPPFYSDLHG
jgi:hypothetical protein